MAFLSIEAGARTGRSVKDRLSATSAWLSRAFEAYAERRGRFAEIRALEAKTDEELAAMGIARSDIVRHVFRDKFFL